MSKLLSWDRNTYSLML